MTKWEIIPYLVILGWNMTWNITFPHHFIRSTQCLGHNSQFWLFYTGPSNLCTAYLFYLWYTIIRLHVPHNVLYFFKWFSVWEVSICILHKCFMSFITQRSNLRLSPQKASDMWLICFSPTWHLTLIKDIVRLPLYRMANKVFLCETVIRVDLKIAFLFETLICTHITHHLIVSVVLL